MVMIIAIKSLMMCRKKISKKRLNENQIKVDVFNVYRCYCNKKKTK